MSVTINCVTPHVFTNLSSPLIKSGTPPPCWISSGSLARASRISAWRSESLTCRASSSKATTRYSIFVQSASSPYRFDHAYHTSSPHSSASRSFPLLRFHISNNCLTAYQHLPQQNSSSGSPYLNAPLAHMAGRLLRFGPVQRCPDRTVPSSTSFQVVAARQVSYSSPISTRTSGCSSRLQAENPCYFVPTPVFLRDGSYLFLRGLRTRR